MPLRGETIGTAFVRILADGSGFDDSAKEEIRDANDTFEEGGRENAKSYNKGWVTEFEKGLEESQKSFAKSQRDMVNQNRGMRAQFTKIENDFHKTRRSIQADTDALFDQIGDLWDTMDQAEENFSRRSETRWERWSKNVDKHFRTVEFNIDVAAASMRRHLSDLFDFDDDGNRAEIAFRRVGHGFDILATKAGRLSGRGARNNFFNLFGIMVENAIRLVGVLPKVGEGISGLFGGGGGSEKFVKLLGSAGSSLAGIAIVLGIIITIAGPAVALFSGLAAALISLVSTVAFAAAAIGGLAFVIGGVLTAGVVTAIIALTNLDKATKRATTSMGKSFKALGKSAGEAIGPGLRKAIKIGQPAIKELEPLVDAIAQSLGRVAIGWAKITRSQAFIEFRDAMTIFIPHAIRSLGGSFGFFATGMMGVFRALIPLADRFLRWLRGVTGEFATWANEPEGQRKLVKFFEDAGDSAKALGGFLVAALDTLGTLLGKGRQEGDNIFESMTSALEGMTAWLEDPKNQKSIEEFFANGRQTAIDLGHIIERISGLLDELDSQENRERMQSLLEAIEDVVFALDKLVAAFDTVMAMPTASIDIVWGDHDPASILEDIGLMAFSSFTVPLKIAVELTLADWKQELIKHEINEFFHSLASGLADLWDWVIPDISWSDLIPDISWGDLIPDISWSDLIPPVSWSDLIPPINWGMFVPKISWLTLGGRLNWSSLITHLNWANFIPVIAWIKLAGKIDWGDLIPDINWSDFVPDLNIHINWPSPPGWFTKALSKGGNIFSASGGVFTGPTARIIGEAGPEAVVPLNRPLAMVDPSVRALSAFAQGIPFGGVSTNQTNSRSIDVGGITVVTPTRDPRAVAAEVVNRLAAVGY